MVARKLVARTFALSLACLTQIDGAHGCQIEAASEPIEEPRYYTWIDGIKQPLTLDTGCIVVLRKVDADAKVATDNAAWDEAKKADRSFLLKHGISAEAIQPNDLVRMWQVSLEARALDAAGVEGVVRAIAEDDSMMYCGPVFKDSQTGRRRWMKQSAVLEFDLDIDEPTALKLIQKDLPGEVVRKQKFGNRFQWQLQSTERSGFTLLNRLNAVATKQHVLCAEPIWVEPLQRNDIDRTSPQSALGVPEDEFVNAQWWIHNVGQHGYTPGLDMDL